MDITPELAERWLKNNFRNRPVRDDVVIAYARDMVNDQWIATHQGIAFNDKDELIDGQHRLLAIVRAKKTVRMMVTFGLPSKIPDREMTTMDCVDRGRTRSVGDQLGIQHRMNNGTIVASVCSALASLCYEPRLRRLSVGQTLDVFRAFEPAILYVVDQRSRLPGLRVTGVMAGFAFALMATHKASMPKGESFAEKRKWVLSHWGKEPVAQMLAWLNTGIGDNGKDLNATTAMSRLREFLLSDEAKLLTRRLDSGLAELVCQAIRIELQGKQCFQLAAVQEGVIHFRGLQKERVEKVAALFRLPTATQGR